MKITVTCTCGGKLETEGQDGTCMGALREFLEQHEGCCGKDPEPIVVPNVVVPNYVPPGQPYYKGPCDPPWVITCRGGSSAQGKFPNVYGVDCSSGGVND